ncbi:TIM-barrel domain-containing protein [Mucilaginibacter sp. PAMB04274]|uniref:glycoside hydrolase family 31 protein n=1 Tax=Mucilaginibacter sp. PAMB04274 TaxID=3138568 RepID=UPI0031F6EA20
MKALYKLLFLAGSSMICLPATILKAQTVKGLVKDGSEYVFKARGESIRLQFCSPTMFRVRMSHNGKFEPDEFLMQESYSWPNVAVKATATKTGVQLATAKIKVLINSSPFKVSVYNLTGKLLSADQDGAWQKGESAGCTKQLQADEHFFGFGERMDFIDQRNKKLNLNVGRGKSINGNHLVGAYNINEANYSPIPFFMSTRGYGVFLHTPNATTWDMGSQNGDQYSFASRGGQLDYYFMYGPDFPSILKSYISITGKAPMLPKFAFGLHMGTYSGGTWGHEEQTSDAYVIALARKMREMGIPVDILFLDSTWRIFGKVGGKGATSFEWRETFKNPKAMFDTLYGLNYKVVGLHLRPRFDNGKTYDLLDQARAKGYTYPENGKPGEFVNFFDQKATDWWWNNGVMRVASIGAKMLKTDEGSAFGHLANESDKVGPTGKEIEKLHNVFPIAYAKAPYLKFQELNGFRGVNQTREGYAGIQRYPYIFAGDWPSEWQYFAPVIKAGLNVGLSGVGYWSHCMGGFEHAADPELYIRWVQFGMFSPVAMVFGMDHPGYKEPWNYGAEGLANFKKYDQLRYRLTPYIYSSAHNQYETGMPLMRALVLNYQSDPNVYDIGDQYLFGNNMMVCPVTVKGAQTRTVYLPEGNWVDYWTGQTYTGKQYIHVVTPLDKLPLYVKAGSIIPMQPEMNYMDAKATDVITLDIFPSAASSFDLYEDDGLSLKYKQGDYSQTHISSALTASGYTLTVNKPQGKFIPGSHAYVAKIRWDRATPNSVTENGQAIKQAGDADALQNASGWYYDKNSKVLWIKTIHSNRENIALQVK